MKKLFMFLAVAGLATFGASCSKSDDNGGGTPPPGEKQLAISADKSAVVEGESVTFTAKVDGKAESGVDFYVNEAKVANPYKFDKKGDYKVVGKKKGFKDSTSLVIKVTEKGTTPEEKQLVLIATPTTVKVGEKVMFIVKAGSDIITDATITQVGGAVVAGGAWTATAEGVVKFKATKAGAKDSAEVSVTVEKAPVAPTTNFYKVGNESTSIVDQSLLISINDQNQALLYNDELEDGTKYWFLVYTLESGTGDDSNFASVEFFAITMTQPTKIFTPKEADALILSDGFVAKDGKLQAEINADDKTAKVTFASWSAVPASQNAPGQVSYQLASAAFSLNYTGDYEGTFGKQASKSGAKAKSSTSPKGFVIEKSKYNLKF